MAILQALFFLPFVCLHAMVILAPPGRDEVQSDLRRLQLLRQAHGRLRATLPHDIDLGHDLDLGDDVLRDFKVTEEELDRLLMTAWGAEAAAEASSRPSDDLSGADVAQAAADRSRGPAGQRQQERGGCGTRGCGGGEAGKGGPPPDRDRHPAIDQDARPNTLFLPPHNLVMDDVSAAKTRRGKGERLSEDVEDDNVDQGASRAAKGRISGRGESSVGLRHRERLQQRELEVKGEESNLENPDISRAHLSSSDRVSSERTHRSSTRGHAQRRNRRSTRGHAQRQGRIGKEGEAKAKVIRAQVELLVVVEYSIFSKFLDSNHGNHQATHARIRRYYGIVVAMVDQRFKTISDRRLSIGVAISGILVAESPSDFGWPDKHVDWSQASQHNGRAAVNTDQALLSFSTWIKGSYQTLPKFDHAMIFSGYRLSNKYGATFGGKAYLSAICDLKNGNSVSIVSDTGDFQCVKVAAHELAHSLGSVHDGDPGFESCGMDDNYVMAPVATYNSKTLPNAFKFSDCSVRQMKQLLRKKKKTRCLRDSPTVFFSYDLHRLPPGKIISPDQHCQLIYGSQSTFCNEKEINSFMCSQLWCRDPATKHGSCRTNTYLTALPGTICGHEMSCHLGHCMLDKVIDKMTSDPAERRPNPYEQQRGYGTGVAGGERVRPSVGDPDLDNSIPTLPQSLIRGRLGRPRAGQAGATPSRADHLVSTPTATTTTTVSSQSRHPTKPRSRNRARRKGSCRENEPDQNVEYCRGLVTLNPDACKRRDIRNYCCRTCDFRR